MFGEKRREGDVTGEEEVERDDYDEEGGEAIGVVVRVVPHRRRGGGGGGVDACLAPTYAMYHLLKGLHEHLTRKDEFSVIIIGLDGAGKTVCS